MISNTTIGILCGLVSMAAFGIADAITKKAVQDIEGKTMLFYRALMTGIILFFVFIFFPIGFKFSLLSLKYILLAVIIAFLGIFPVLFYYKAMKIGKVGVVSPISNLSVVFTVMFSLIFLGEKLTKIQWVIIPAIILGVILISMKPKNIFSLKLGIKNLKENTEKNLKKFSAGVSYAIVAAFLWGIVRFLWKYPTNIIGPVLNSFIIEFGIAFFLMPIALQKKNLVYAKNVFSRKFSAFLAVAGIAAACAVGTLAFNLGIKAANVSIVAAVASASPLVAILAAFFMFKERLTILQYLGGLVIITSVILLFVV